MAGVSTTYTWNDLLTLAMFNFYGTGKIADNIFKGLILVEYMNKAGNVERKGGGDRILVPLMYGKNTTAKSYRSYDVIDVTPQDVFTNAEFQWKQSAASVVISGLELRARNGPQQVKDVLKARIESAELSLRDELNRQFYLDGTGNNSKDFTGLNAAVPEDPTTGTYGGIDRSAAGNTFWQSYQANTITFSSAGIAKMKTAWRKVSLNRRSGVPTLILCTSAAYGMYEDTLVANERFIIEKSGQRGEAVFGPLSFKGIPLEWDENAPLDSNSTDQMWFLNTNYFKLILHPDADFKPTPFKTPPDQDASVAQILVQGELVCNNARHQGRLWKLS